MPVKPTSSNVPTKSKPKNTKNVKPKTSPSSNGKKVGTKSVSKTVAAAESSQNSPVQTELTQTLTPASTQEPSVTTTTPTPTPTPTSSSTTPTTIPATTSIKLEKLQASIVAITSQIRELSRECTAVQKEYVKEKKCWERQLEKHRRSKKGSNKPAKLHNGGIAKPGYISDELCTFIGVEANTKMARTEVIKYINKYIKDHNLQDSKNKKVIVPDEKLQKLLRSDPTKGEVTYFNLQSYMKPHLSDPNKTTVNTNNSV